MQFAIALVCGWLGLSTMACFFTSSTQPNTDKFIFSKNNASIQAAKKIEKLKTPTTAIDIRSERRKLANFHAESKKDFQDNKAEFLDQVIKILSSDMSLEKLENKIGLILQEVEKYHQFYKLNCFIRELKRKAEAKKMTFNSKAYKLFKAKIQEKYGCDVVSDEEFENTSSSPSDGEYKNMSKNESELEQGSSGSITDSDGDGNKLSIYIRDEKTRKVLFKVMRGSIFVNKQAISEYKKLQHLASKDRKKMGFRKDQDLLENEKKPCRSEKRPAPTDNGKPNTEISADYPTNGNKPNFKCKKQYDYAVCGKTSSGIELDLPSHECLEDKQTKDHDYNFKVDFKRFLIK